MTALTEKTKKRRIQRPTKKISTMTKTATILTAIVKEESEGEDFNPDGVDDEEEEDLDDEEEEDESTARGQKRKLPDDGDPTDGDPTAE
ncbi:unnamed protein product [Medioppia subpectinata]|uniref:Uncharacterized protein n=1 Tax=Medioppia subpectinata TaxID=1979941 RepID=A0A7R9LKR5_9ACAR|nr:unnamed protein product [Medioppia subpectinata]CAG2119126.1 unnamed protein product [Medioppia subpectinata]